MAKIEIICGDAGEMSGKADMILTDPPFDMPGARLAEIIGRYDVGHLVLITTMRQLLEFMRASRLKFCFDFVLDGVAPKKAKSTNQPNYTHQTGVYLKADGAPSRFDRKLRQRSDCFSAAVGFWPTIVRAPREDMGQFGIAKNLAAITDILGSFKVSSVIDPFGGSGTTAIAAIELDIDCTIIDIDHKAIDIARERIGFLGR